MVGCLVIVCRSSQLEDEGVPAPTSSLTMPANPHRKRPRRQAVLLLFILSPFSLLFPVSFGRSHCLVSEYSIDLNVVWGGGLNRMILIGALYGSASLSGSVRARLFTSRGKLPSFPGHLLGTNHNLCDCTLYPNSLDY